MIADGWQRRVLGQAVFMLCVMQAGVAAGTEPCPSLRAPEVVSYKGQERRLLRRVVDLVERSPQEPPPSSQVGRVFADCLERLRTDPDARDAAQLGVSETEALPSLRFVSTDDAWGYEDTAGRMRTRKMPSDVSRLAALATKRLIAGLPSATRAVVERWLWYLWFESYLAALGDPYNDYDYASTMVEERAISRGRSFAVGFEIDLVHGRATIAEIADDALAGSGLAPGDLLLALDGRGLAEIGLPDLQNYWFSPVPFQYEVLVSGRGGDLRLHSQSVPSRHRTVQWAVHHGLGYVRIRRFSSGTLVEIRRALRALEAAEVAGLIVDLRHNPGGTLSTDVVDVFLKPGQVLATYREHAGGDPVDVPATIEYCDLPMAVLVDEESVSMAESMAAALQYHARAVLVGETTHGKGVGQGVYPVRDEGRLHLVNRTYYLPGTGETWNLVGLKPDLPVAPDAQERERIDELLRSPLGDMDQLWRTDPVLRAAAGYLEESR